MFSRSIEHKELDRATDLFIKRFLRAVERRLKRRKIENTRDFSEFVRDIERLMDRIMEGVFSELMRRFKNVAERKASWATGDEVKLTLGRPLERRFVLLAVNEFKDSFRRLLRRMYREIVEELAEPEYDEEKIIKKIKKVAMKYVRSQGRTIVRTEIHNIYAKAREEMYSKYEEEAEVTLLYRWLSANDFRTCKVCREIERRTKKGVTMDRLKDVIRDVMRKHGLRYDPRKPFTVHPNDRCTFIVVGYKE